jgi:hypothetical protein
MTQPGVRSERVNEAVALLIQAYDKRPKPWERHNTRGWTSSQVLRFATLLLEGEKPIRAGIEVGKNEHAARLMARELGWGSVGPGKRMVFVGRQGEQQSHGL